MNEKINILEKNLRHKFKDVTDFDFNKVATEFINRGGWSDDKTLEQALEGCRLFMTHNLKTKGIDIF